VGEIILINFSSFTFNTIDTSIFAHSNVNNTGDKKTTLSFSSIDFQEQSHNNLFSFIEGSGAQRLNRFSSAIISYDYKTGHYVGI
jgi:hypothetical protein